MFQNDYIMREIGRLTQMLGMILTGRKVEVEEFIDEHGLVTGDALILQTLLKMVEDGDINAAENLLFEHLDAEPRHTLLEVAIRFYSRLNTLDDEQLERCDYSREEIADGLRMVERRYISTDLEDLP